MDIIEIDKPFCIVTASLDRTIRLYNFEEKYLIAVFKGHESGFRNLTYCSLYGGFLVSAGHEPYCNVWTPETAVSRPLLGKLPGH